MFKICDSLGPGAELKLMKICGGKTVAGLHVEHQDSSVQRQWLQKDRSLEHVPKQRTPFRATLTVWVSAALGVGTITGPSPLLPDIRPPMKDVSAGGYSDPKEHLGGVCMGGLKERSLWDALSCLWVRFLRVDVWKQCGSLCGDS